MLHSRYRWTKGQNLLDVHCTLLWFDVDTSKYVWAESSVWLKSNAHGFKVFEPHIISFEVHKILIIFFPLLRIWCFHNAYFFSSEPTFLIAIFVILKNNISKSLQQVNNFCQSVWLMHVFWLCLDFFWSDVIWLKSGFLKQIIALNFEQKMLLR